MKDTKELIERLVKDKEAMDILCRSIVDHPRFARDLIEALNDAIADGSRLHTD